MLQIINPDLQEAIKWFNDVKDALKNWHNDIIISNRILGIYDDNFYDTTVFEKAIMQHFFLSKKPKGEQTITITFNRMVELVELGARRFNY